MSEQHQRRDAVSAWAGMLSRVSLWLCMAASVAWLAFLAWNAIVLTFDLVPSSDIGWTFFVPVACGTGPVAVLVIVVGVCADRGVSRSRAIPTVLKPSNARLR